ncbi:MAG: ferrous iron transport protein A [Clostridia bacterium]|nr:ferrous iron transport protein A [Clostridia bacterium]
MDDYLTLNNLKIGESAKVEMLTSTGVQRRRMLDLGLIKGTTVQAVLNSPSGDPVAYFIRGTLIALRDEDAKKIYVTATI